MFAVVFRILLRAAFTLLLLTACVFFGLHMTGDPARIMLGNAANEVALEAFRAQWGLNLPLWQQFLVYLEKFVSLDMGTSYMTGQPVRDVFLDALGPTLSLMIPTAVVTLLIGIPSGVCAALHRNTLLDRSLMVMSVFGYAVPNFFMGVLLLNQCEHRFAFHRGKQLPDRFPIHAADLVADLIQTACLSQQAVLKFPIDH